MSSPGCSSRSTRAARSQRPKVPTVAAPEPGTSPPPDDTDALDAARAGFWARWRGELPTCAEARRQAEQVVRADAAPSTTPYEPELAPVLRGPRKCKAKSLLAWFDSRLAKELRRCAHSQCGHEDVRISSSYRSAKVFTWHRGSHPSEAELFPREPVAGGDNANPTCRCPGANANFADIHANVAKLSARSRTARTWQSISLPHHGLIFYQRIKCAATPPLLGAWRRI